MDSWYTAIHPWRIDAHVWCRPLIDASEGAWIGRDVVMGRRYDAAPTYPLACEE